MSSPELEAIWLTDFPPIVFYCSTLENIGFVIFVISKSFGNFGNQISVLLKDPEALNKYCVF